MKSAFRLGRLFGIPLEVRTSFLLLLAAVALFMGGLAGIFVVLLVFASIVAHELGHALVARKLEVEVSTIELHFFGGVARLQSQPRSARDELAIAAAGPAVSFAIGFVALALAWLSGSALIQLLATINLVLGAFNLIPAFPMDGGRILRALLAPRIGFQRSTEVAVRISRAVSIAFAIFGLAFMQIQLLLLAGVLWYMGSHELRGSRVHGYDAGSAFRVPAAPAWSRVHWSDNARSPRTERPFQDRPPRVVITRIE